jgi:hypothetical protein
MASAKTCPHGNKQLVALSGMKVLKELQLCEMGR